MLTRLYLPALLSGGANVHFGGRFQGWPGGRDASPNPEFR